jgi:hypothetical protein
MLCGVECDHANRVGVLARHQIGDDGFEVGLLDIGFGKRGAKVSEIIDDKINGLIVIGWHNRRGPISAHEKTPNATNVRNLSIKSDPLKPQLITADHPR